MLDIKGVWLNAGATRGSEDPNFSHTNLFLKCNFLIVMSLQHVQNLHIYNILYTLQ